MLNIGHKHRKRIAILLVVAGLAVAAGLVINQGANEFVIPTAIGETNETFDQTEDFQYLERTNRAFINLVARTRSSVVQITTKIERNPESMDREEFRREFDVEPWFRFRLVILRIHRVHLRLQDLLQVLVQV